MKKQYVAPLSEDIKVDALMVDYLDIQAVSAPQTGVLQ